METPNSPTPPPKYGLKSTKELNLSMYVFIARVGGVVVNVPQAVELIFGYTQDEAMTTLNQKYPMDKVPVFDPKGQVPVSNLLELIEQKAEGQPVETKVKTKADYYAELILDLKKISADNLTKDQQKVFSEVIDKLEGIVKETQLFQQL